MELEQAVEEVTPELQAPELPVGLSDQIEAKQHLERVQEERALDLQESRQAPAG
jgi:hypothetical protein